MNSNCAIKSFARFGCSFRRTDQLDDLIDVIERFLQTFEDVGAGFGLAQFVLRAAADDIDAMLDEDRSSSISERPSADH